MTLSHDISGPGDGAAVVLIHSAVCDRGMWDPQWTALIDAGYRTVRCDLRGFGLTPMPDAPHNDARDVVDLLDALGVGPVAVVGSSFGGRVAMEIAARWPDRVTALALLCSGLPGHPRSPELTAFGDREEELIGAGDVAGATDLNVATWLGPEADEPTRERVRRMQRHAFEVQLAVAEEFDPISVDFELTAVTAPALVVSGGHDLPDFRQIAALLPGRLPGARHVELPWAGHLPSLERPAEVTAMLLDLLSRRVSREWPPTR